MKIFLRNFEVVVIFHFTGDILTHDIQVLKVGMPKVLEEKLPVILDFEKAQFKENSLALLQVLLKELHQKNVEHCIVSSVIPAAHAKTFTEALATWGHPKVPVISEAIALETKLRRLEDEDQQLDEAIKQMNTGEKNLKAVEEEFEKLDWISKQLDRSIKIENDLQTTFQGILAAEKRTPSTALEDKKKEVLAVLKELGAL